VIYEFDADSIDRAVKGLSYAAACFLGLRVLIPLGYGYLSEVSVVCCQVEVSASGWSLIQRIRTECGVSEWEWSWSLDNGDALANWGLLRHEEKNMNLGADVREVWEWLVSRLVLLGLWIFFLWYSGLNVFRKTHMASTLGRQVSQQANIFKLNTKTCVLLKDFWIAKILRIYSMVDEWNMSEDCWLTDWLTDWMTDRLTDWLTAGWLLTDCWMTAEWLLTHWLLTDCWLTDWYWQGKTKMLGEKLAVVSLRLPQILHWLAWVPARIFALISTHWFRCELTRYSQLQDTLYCLKNSHHYVFLRSRPYYTPPQIIYVLANTTHHPKIIYVLAHTTHHPRSFFNIATYSDSNLWRLSCWQRSKECKLSTLFLLHFNIDTVTVNCFQFCVRRDGTSPYLGSTVTGYWEECMYIRGKEYRLVKAPQNRPRRPRGSRGIAVLFL
jgi:hypothetical protein